MVKLLTNLLKQKMFRGIKRHIIFILLLMKLCRWFTEIISNIEQGSEKDYAAVYISYLF